MTQDEIIRMAREAKIECGLNPWQEAVQDRLVVVHGLTDENANDPRKAIADLIRIETQIALDPAVSSDAHALIAAEREACAKVCDDQVVSKCLAPLEIYRTELIAAAIRARGEK